MSFTYSAGATSLLSMTSAVSDYNEYDEIGEVAKNGVVNLASNSTEICDFICQAGVDYGTAILACKATDSGIDLAADKFGINDYLKEGLKFSVDSYMTYKISNIGKAGNKKPKVVESQYKDR